MKMDADAMSLRKQHKRKTMVYTIKVKVFNILVFIVLGVANIAIKLISFKRLSGWLSNHSSSVMEANPSGKGISDYSAKTRSRLRLLVKTIEAMSLKTPWRSKCFEQAITCAFFLRLEKLDYIIFFGLKKDESEGFLAHAWTQSGPYYLTGYGNSHEFSVVYKAAYRH